MGCTNLKAAIKTRPEDPNQGEGDVIVLSGLCNAANLGSSAGVTLPPGSNFSIEGAPGTTSGFDGAGVSATLLTSGTEAVGAMTLSNLTFEHAEVTENSGSALSIRAARVTLNKDTFLENTLHGVSGGAASIHLSGKPPSCPPASEPAAVTLTNSSFRANKLVVSAGLAAGGALFIGLECATSRSVLEGNSFEGNTIEASTPSEATGGALMFENDSKVLPAPVSQRGNVFDSNRIISPSEEANYGGGGEWLEGASLMSVGDRFSRNALPGTGGSKWSWGGGLGILNTNCNTLTQTESTLENAVVAGNSIGAGTPADLSGAGIYVGCSPSKTHPNHLSLLNSTVTQNTVPSGGIAGIAGNPGDQLNIANSIVAADVGGDEIGGFGGFGGAGGSLSAAFSDVCAAGSTSPLAGTGNICANPLLRHGEGSPFDVHETGSSPTIDAGANALVPGGLSTDFYGNSRVLSAHSFIPGCSAAVMFVGPTLSPAVVDIGASEFGPVAVPAIALACPPTTTVPVSPPATGPKPLGLVALVTQRANGQLLIKFKNLPAGQVSVLARFKLAKRVFAIVKGHRKRVTRIQTITYGMASHKSASASNVTLVLKPTKPALALLERKKRLKVQLLITFVRAGTSPSSRNEGTGAITVVFKAAHKKAHR